MNVLRAVVALIPIGIALVACSTDVASSGYSDGRIGVAVYPPGDDVVLEIGAHAWDIPDGGNAVALAEATGPTTVRLVRPSDCSVIVAFIGEPNRRYAVEASVELEADWHDTTAEGFPMGPATDETKPTGCP